MRTVRHLIGSRTWLALLAFLALPAAALDLPTIEEPLHGGLQKQGDYGVVVGIEHYPFLLGMKDVAYAYRDAEAFETLLIYTMGVPPDRVEMLRGGRRKMIEAALREAGERTGPEDTVWVYFSGHGAASAADDEPLLLGDTVSRDATQFESEGVRVDDAQRLAGVGGARVVLVVDACYTGVGRDGEQLDPKAKYVPHSAVTVRRGATVWSAASSNEAAGPFDPAQHSAFTYFAVGALRGWADGELDGTRDGRVTASEANQYVSRALRAAGIRSQTPSLAGGTDELLVRSDRLERGPDLVALRESLAPTPPQPVAPPVVGSVVVTPGSETDLASLAAAAAQQAQEREDLEQRQAEADRRRAAEAEQLRRDQEELARREREVQEALEADRRRRLDGARTELEDAAQQDWLALADVREAAVPEAVPVVEAFIDKYEGSVVTVDGDPYPVEIALADEAREWLRRHAGKLGGGGTGGSVIDQHGYEMVRIEPGEFWMGSPSDEEGRDDDETRHKVRITKAFVMGATEVTQELYKAVMGENPSRFKGGRNPVEQVSWHDAVKLCNRLSEQEGLEPAYRISGETVTWDRSATGYRLPTEAEWEYSARGGEEHVYSGSEDIGDVAWYRDNSGYRSHEVGGKRANGWGLYDMTGNVWEWVWDWNNAYPSETVTDPMGPSTGYSRIFRGGSRSAFPRFARVALHSGRDPGYRGSCGGFRLARSIP